MSTETTLGGDEDTVSLLIGGERLLLSMGYEIACSFLTVPAAFSLTISAGTGTSLADFIAKWPPRTAFQLQINVNGAWRTIQTGFTDGFQASYGDGGRSFKCDGRDILQVLHDAFVLEESSFSKITYANLVEAAIKLVFTGKLPELVYTNESNRKAISGASIRQNGPPRDVQLDQIETVGGGVVKRLTQAKLGERWYDFLKRHLDRVGLFLWAGGDGSLVISEPNTKQAPIARIFHRPERGESNVLSCAYSVNTVDRYSQARVYVRGGATTYSRTKATGTYDDAEMKGYGYEKPYVERDTSADTKAKADFVARRRIAESRRRGWSLTYTVAGHTTPALYGGDRCVWAPDTMIEVDDQEIGVKGVFWCEGVKFRQSPHKTTEITLQRAEDQIYATGE